MGLTGLSRRRSGRSFRYEVTFVSGHADQLWQAVTTCDAMNALFVQNLWRRAQVSALD